METIKLVKQNPVNFVFSVNFAAFNFIAGNRPQNDSHVANIEAAMRRGDFIPPIIVDEHTLSVIDGQHRYLAACNIWKKGGSYELSVMLVPFSNPLLAAINYNNSSKRWTMDNYVNAYIADNRQSYFLLKRFCETHKLLISKNITQRLQYKAAAQLLTHDGCSTCLRKGTLVVTEQQCEEAEITYHQLEMMINTTNCISLISRDHVLAWIETKDFILSRIKMDKFLKALKKYFVIPVSDTKEAWIAMYLEIASKVK